MMKPAAYKVASEGQSPRLPATICPTASGVADQLKEETVRRIIVACGFFVSVCTIWADEIVLVAGGGTGGDGSPAKQAKLIEPFGIEFHGGNAYFVEMEPGHRLRLIDSQGRVTTVAGREGKSGFESGVIPAHEALFRGPHNLAIAPDGTIYIADTFNHCIRVYDPKKQTVATLAGNGEAGFSGDGGPASQAQFNQMYCVALDPAGKRLIVTDLGNRRIREIDLSTGKIRTIAGNGHRGVPQDGQPAVQQPLVDPRAAVADRAGRIWILERGGHALRVVLPDGTIRTVAGTGKPGAALGPALQAGFNGPKHLCVDRDDSILIADTENHRIVRYDPRSEQVTLVAGCGKRGTSGLGGDPKQVELNRPHGVTVHPETGEIYICDSSNHRILKIVRKPNQ
jgi:DNA-binding beta-propeller fold protein YncE